MPSRPRKPPAPKSKGKPKPELKPFHIMRLTGSPAKLVGIVHATDAEAAIAEAIKIYRIRPIDVGRLIAVPV